MVTRTAATVVPAGALSSSDAAVGENVIAIGVGARFIVMVKVAEPLKFVLMPSARTRTE